MHVGSDWTWREERISTEPDGGESGVHTLQSDPMSVSAQEKGQEQREGSATYSQAHWSLCWHHTVLLREADLCS